ncbi:GNAT family N-acetyltransferase [Arthrobacter sp. UYCu712]|uniref:GNAT family N-acetyltransferase n=1 Tax=Arthrobacter sp. UYCu712 TaxID=3156340 RepID=UPI00339AA5B6
MENAEGAPQQSSETTLSPIVIRHNPDRSRYEVHDGDTVIGQAAYVDRDDERQRVFYHTVIEEAYGGQGLAGILAAQALDETVAAGLAIVPVCPYIKTYLEKHPEYSANVQKPTSTILEFLSASLAQRTRR